MKEHIAGRAATLFFRIDGCKVAVMNAHMFVDKPATPENIHIASNVYQFYLCGDFNIETDETDQSRPLHIPLSNIYHKCGTMPI
eukprot:367076-Amphidinium_carterae.4